MIRFCGSRYCMDDFAALADVLRTGQQHYCRKALSNTPEGQNICDNCWIQGVCLDIQSTRTYCEAKAGIEE